MHLKADFSIRRALKPPRVQVLVSLLPLLSLQHEQVGWRSQENKLCYEVASAWGSQVGGGTKIAALGARLSVVHPQQCLSHHQLLLNMEKRCRPSAAAPGSCH